MTVIYFEIEKVFTILKYNDLSLDLDLTHPLKGLTH